MRHIFYRVRALLNMFVSLAGGMSLSSCGFVLSHKGTLLKSVVLEKSVQTLEYMNNEKTTLLCLLLIIHKPT